MPTIKKTFPEFGFLYSIKTNPFEPVIRLIAGSGFGADAASAGEVRKAIACGVAAEDIYYSAPGKSEEDIRSVLGSCTLIADSLHELEMTEHIAAEQDRLQKLGIRVHPAFAMEGEARASKFGIDLEQIEDIKETIRRCPHIEICGIHVHLQSQILDAQKLIRYYCNVMDTALSLQKDCGISLEFINFGSGIGTVYDETKDLPVDLDALHAGCAEIIEKNRSLGARLLIETGRFVTCRAGKYYTPVLDKKTSHGKTYLIVAGGLNGFIRPSIAAMLQKAAEGNPIPGMEPLYTSAREFQVRVISACDTSDSAADEQSGLDRKMETVSIVGNLCTQVDIIAEDILLPTAEIGDLIEISNAGSYGMSLSPVLFASQKRPEELML